ncbi:Radial spoke head protein 4 A, partial [Dinochytrium kinnereticum]
LQQQQPAAAAPDSPSSSSDNQPTLPPNNNPSEPSPPNTPPINDKDATSTAPFDAAPVSPTTSSSSQQRESASAVAPLTAPKTTTTPSTPASIRDLEQDQRVSTVKDKNYDFLKRRDVVVRPDVSLNEDAEFALAKSFLLTRGGKFDGNLYDHLTLTVMRVLETRPKDAVDIFESISSEVKRSKFNVEVPGAPGSIKRVFEESPHLKLYKEHMTLFEKTPEDDEKNEDSVGEIPDVMDLANLWEWAGGGGVPS